MYGQYPVIHSVKDWVPIIRGLLAHPEETPECQLGETLFDQIRSKHALDLVAVELRDELLPLLGKEGP
jgi:hypothetical protein